MLEQQLRTFYKRQKDIQIQSTIWNVLANDQNNHMPPQAQKTRIDQMNAVSQHMQDLSQHFEYTSLV